ncbi:MAG: CehA/McbA family metallohydrolase, partial [Pirellulales bacterium]|nr:CehA/McbA family metallohydrolase [Pirellulales bacterium]
ATLRTVQVKPGETTTVREQLRRSVNTSGWLSSDLHSHASESGDNITTQRGRVLNLLAEHLEFIPCTEHQRTSSYQPHLDYFGTAHRVLTCPGVELSGLPVALNHQNAFPLIHRPRTQDGGAPPVHVNPVAQIARLAMWDNQSDKVVQVNHPRTPQMLGDADRDGKPDEGFRKIFHYADIMEVHPLEEIFTGPETYREQGEGEVPRIQNWLQMLNLGYRLPGVVNTDAHRNYHGSGYLRNYIRSSTDDPSEADLMEICHALERGQVVMSNGPFMEVDAFSADDHVGPGEDLLSTTGAVNLQIRVECPNWLDVNRVQVLVNGRPDERFNFTRRSHGKMFGNDTIKFNNRIRLSLPTDAHLIVVAAAEGRHLGKVFGPEHGELMPVAVSNPIFVDTDENGFQANGDLLGFPLPVESDHQPTHGHDHAKTSATFNE